MKFKNENVKYGNEFLPAEVAYQKWKAVNKGDPYGERIFEYAEDWANLMEKDIEKGVSISEMANYHSRTADHDGITGYMYGAAVSVLSLSWLYGEDLRLWHNNKTQIRNEGDLANKDKENKPVLNPALLNINL